MEALAECEVVVREWLRHLYVRNLAPRSIDTYRRRVLPFLAWLKAKRIPLQAVDFRVLEDWILHLRQEDNATESVSISLASIKSLWKWMRREGMVPVNPFADLEPLRHEKKLPEFSGVIDTAKVIESSDRTRDRAILEVFYATGCRRAEIHGMDLKDLQLDEADPLVKIRKGKGRKERLAVLNKSAVLAIKAWLPDRIAVLSRKHHEYEEALWVSRLGLRLSESAIYDVVVRAGKLAGVDAYPHKLRHSIATHLLNRGANLREVQEFLNHENLQTTQVYTHVAIEHLKETVRRTHPRG